jgi:Flp pilus assembly protein TadB
MLRSLAAAIALAVAALSCAAFAYAALYPQTGAQGPRSATLTPGTAELLEDLGGPGVLSGDFWGSTTGGTTHAGYGSDFRSYHYHGEALDLRVDKSLWDVLYGAMGRADYGLVELFGPWGLYKNGVWLDPATHPKLWRGHQNHIHVSFTGTPDVARAIVGVQPPAPPPAPKAAPPAKPKRQLAAAAHAKPELIRITPPRPRPLPTVRELSLVTLRPLASAAAAVPQGAGILYGSVGTVLLAFIVCLLVAGAAMLTLLGRREKWLETRLAAHVAPPPVEQPLLQQQRRAVLTPLFAATERLVGNVDVYRKAARLLERADLPLRAVEFLYLSAGAAFLCGILGAVSAGGFGGFLGIVIGAAGPWMFVRMKARRRSVAFDNQLPDVLVTLASSLKSGHSFRQGLQAVADEGQPPISKELVRVLAEARLGRPLDEALADMTERVGSKDLDFLLAAITIQTQVGGSMAGLFDLVSDTIRERQQFARKIAGLTATGRASAKVLIGLPAFLAFALTLINHDYMSPLFHTTTGHMLLGTGLLMTAIGALILRKMVSFTA